jgi:hypothetical protein
MRVGFFCSKMPATESNCNPVQTRSFRFLPTILWLREYMVRCRTTDEGIAFTKSNAAETILRRPEGFSAKPSGAVGVAARTSVTEEIQGERFDRAAAFYRPLEQTEGHAARPEPARSVCG